MLQTFGGPGRFVQDLGPRIKTILGKPVGHNDGLLLVNSGLLWGIVASHFGLLGKVPG